MSDEEFNHDPWWAGHIGVITRYADDGNETARRIMDFVHDFRSSSPRPIEENEKILEDVCKGMATHFSDYYTRDLLAGKYGQPTLGPLRFNYKQGSPNRSDSVKFNLIEIGELPLGSDKDGFSYILPKPDEDHLVCRIRGPEKWAEEKELIKYGYQVSSTRESANNRFGISFESVLMIALYSTLGTFIVNGFTNKALEQKVNQMKPKANVEQVLGNELPERFYYLDGDTAFVAIDGKPVSQYVKETREK
ncbi:MAG: hypothetical protein ABIH34_06845 [Nanoarchaeota archaeon]